VTEITHWCFNRLKHPRQHHYGTSLRFSDGHHSQVHDIGSPGHVSRQERPLQPPRLHLLGRRTLARMETKRSGRYRTKCSTCFPHALIYPLSYYCAFQPSSAPAGPPLGGPSFRSDKRPCASDVPSKRSSALVQQNAADCTCSCFYSRALSAALLFTPKVYVVDQTTDSWSVFHLASWEQHLAPELHLTVTSTTSLHFNISTAIKHSQRDSP
jgi:hypothetical protein